MKKYLLLCLVAFQISHAYGVTKVNVNGVFYNLTPEKVGTAEVTYGSSDYSGAIVIPETIEYDNYSYKVTSIGKYAFQYSKITSIDIPSSISVIGSYAFDHCTDINEVRIHSLQAWCEIQFGSNPLLYAKSLLLNGEIIRELVVPEQITRISNHAFYNYQALTSVKITKNIKAIGEYAFSKCPSLNSVVIDEGVDTIYKYAFSECVSLTTVKLSNTLNIGQYVFSGCSSLSSLNLPENIQAVNHGLCNNCTSLQSVYIPKSVLAIGDYAFRGCEKLKTIYITENVLGMGSSSFGNCENITDVYCYAMTPPIPISTYYKKGINDFFLNSYINYSTLHVPQSSIEKYKNAFSWSDFGNIVALTEEDTGVTTERINVNNIKDFYSIDGRHLDVPHKGINIVKMANGRTKKVIIK